MKKILIAVASCGLLFAGCSQSLLDIPQKGVIAIDDFYKTDEDAKMALTAAYADMATNYVAPLYNDNIIYALWNYVGDDMYAAGNNKTDNIGENELNAFRFPITSGLINTGYTSFFRSVYAANLVISRFAEGTTPYQKKVVAEAKVLRALSYLQLAIGWGTPPIVDHPLAVGEKPSNAESQAAVLDFIIKDCDEALPLIDERKSQDDKEGAWKVTKGLANTIKGKALLWKKDYAGATKALREVVTSGKYDLLPTDQIEENFHATGDGSKEKVFELNLVWDASVSGYTNHSQANMSWLWNWRSEAIQPDGVGTPIYSQGWGGCNPSKKFVEALIENDGINSARRKAWVKTYDEVLYDFPYASDGAEPVLGYADWKKTDKARGIKRAAGVYGNCGYFMWKVNVNVQKDLSINNARMQNIRIFRFTEVILMYAEAALQSNSAEDKAIALEWVQKIQRRAESKTVFTELTMEGIKKEKMIECWLEGCRFQDLVRWGDTDELAANGSYLPSFCDKIYFGSTEHEGFVDESDADWCIKLYPDSGFKKGKHELFPFPFNEMSVNENMRQNPGYASE